MRISRDLKSLGRGLEIQKEAPDASYRVTHHLFFWVRSNRWFWGKPIWFNQVEDREMIIIQPINPMSSPGWPWWVSSHFVATSWGFFGNVASRIFLGKILSPFWSSYKMDIPWRTMAPEFFLDRSTRLATPAEFAPRISGSRCSIVWAKILVGPSTCIFANSYGKYHMNINYSCIGKYTTRWWFQIIFYFHPYLGKVSNLTNIFQRGWNHQPDKSNGSYMDGHPPKIWI